MPDLLLTHGYFLYEDPKELQIMKPYAPLGILYLCSHLAQERVRRRSVRYHLFAAGRLDCTTSQRERRRCWASTPT